MPDDTGDAQWGSIAEAARRLGRSRQAVQRRVARGTIETKRERVGNRERVLVRLPRPVPQPVRRPVPQPKQAELIGELRATIADCALSATG